MEQLVTVKSYSKGLTLFIREDSSMEAVLEEIEQKFKQSKAFFGEMQVAISFEGRKLSDVEETSIIEYIQTYSDLQVVCIVGKDQKIQKLFEEGTYKNEKKELSYILQKQKGIKSKCDARVIYQSLNREQEIISPETVIVYGDVNSGAKISSQKDVIILGTLYGEVMAGLDETKGHFVMAFNMQPQKLCIGDKQYKNRQIGIGMFRVNSKKLPMIAFTAEDSIVMKPVTKEILEMRKTFEEV